MIAYNFFQKRYKEIRKKILAVKVDGLPWNASLAPQSPESECLIDAPVQIWVEIWMSIGLQLSQKNLNYWDLVRMVDKLEGLCYDNVNSEGMSEDHKDRFLQYLAE